METGTKSLLFGVHQVFLHPLVVAYAWWRLYGFPADWRLWLCFIVHDWGYWGKAHMDDEEGERHPELGAKIVGSLLDRGNIYGKWETWVDESSRTIQVRWSLPDRNGQYYWVGRYPGTVMGYIAANKFRRTLNEKAAEVPAGIPLSVPDRKWHDFCLYHSRFYAKKHNREFSKLCVADKLSIAILPAWIYVPLAMLTGEIWEYMASCRSATYNPWQWYSDLRKYMFKWAIEHKDNCIVETRSRHFYEEENTDGVEN